MAKYGRYLDAEDRKKNASKEANGDIVLVGLLLAFPFLMMMSLALTGDLKKSTNTESGTINTCAQAQSQWEAALDERDAVTPAEAVTSSGRAKWEQLRSRANQLEQVKNNICN
ncbi:hypothetical protein [Chroococcidiopsis sp.]|uniref:hypothetical protein n=1 Tax=Chroococcidiopsis sp. TaxID=3088168 RepID=UPI003F3C6D2C